MQQGAFYNNNNPRVSRESRTTNSNNISEKLWRSTKEMLENSRQTAENHLNGDEVYTEDHFQRANTERSARNVFSKRNQSPITAEDYISMTSEGVRQFQNMVNQSPQFTPLGPEVDSSSHNSGKGYQRSYQNMTPVKGKQQPMNALKVYIVLPDETEACIQIESDKDISFAVMNFCIQYGIDDIALVEVIRRRILRELVRITTRRVPRPQRRPRKGVSHNQQLMMTMPNIQKSPQKYYRQKSFIKKNTSKSRSRSKLQNQTTKTPRKKTPLKMKKARSKRVLKKNKSNMDLNSSDIIRDRVEKLRNGINELTDKLLQITTEASTKKQKKKKKRIRKKKSKVNLTMTDNRASMRNMETFITQVSRGEETTITDEVKMANPTKNQETMKDRLKLDIEKINQRMNSNNKEKAMDTLQPPALGKRTKGHNRTQSKSLEIDTSRSFRLYQDSDNEEVTNGEGDLVDNIKSPETKVEEIINDIIENDGDSESKSEQAMDIQPEQIVQLQDNEPRSFQAYELIGRGSTSTRQPQDLNFPSQDVSYNDIDIGQTVTPTRKDKSEEINMEKTPPKKRASVDFNKIKEAVIRESQEQYLDRVDFTILNQIFVLLDQSGEGIISASRINLDGVSIEVLETLESVLFEIYQNAGEEVNFNEFISIIMRNEVYPQVQKAARTFLAQKEDKESCMSAETIKTEDGRGNLAMNGESNMMPTPKMVKKTGF